MEEVIQSIDRAMEAMNKVRDLLNGLNRWLDEMKQGGNSKAMSISNKCCDTCEYQGWDMPECRECNEHNGYMWYMSRRGEEDV